MPKLNDTQLVILAAAAKREDGSVLPAPKRLKLDQESIAPVLKGLLKRKLIAESPATGEAIAWRQSQDGARVTLMITESGLQAIGIEPKDPSEGEKAAKGGDADENNPRRTKTKKEGKSNKKEAAAPESKIRSNTKQATVIDMLQKAKGATLEELMEATGWQAHSVRGVMSGALKKKLKLKIKSEKVEGRGRVYRIAERG